MSTEWLLTATAVIGLITAILNWWNSNRKGPPSPPAVNVSPVEVVKIEQDNGARPHRPRQGQ